MNLIRRKWVDNTEERGLEALSHVFAVTVLGRK